MSNSRDEIKEAAEAAAKVLQEAEDSFDRKLTSLERLAAGMLKERRTMRRTIAAGFVATGIAIVLALSSEDHAAQAEKASKDAREAVSAVDQLRRDQGIAVCERVNVVRRQMIRLANAAQHRWETVTSVLDLKANPADPPEVNERRAALAAALEEAAAEFQAAINEVQLTDCLAVTPPTTVSKES